MRTFVSQGSAYDASGVKLCSRCKRRPPKPGQRYCRECHAQYMRDWRAGKVEVLLTPEEWAAVKLARLLGQPIGRHHRGGA